MEVDVAARSTLASGVSGSMTGMAIAVEACLNGSRLAGEHPRLPCDPGRLAEDAAACVAAGARSIHLHARDRESVESLDAGDIGAAVRAVRAAAPGAPISVSTGLWIARGAEEERRRRVAGWSRIEPSSRPDVATVNLSEPGFIELAGELERLGVAIDAGVRSIADADALAAAGIRPRRVLVEIGEDRGDPVETADAILTRLDRHDLAAPRALHGEGATCWDLIRYAARLGLDTRVGLEDTLTDAHGLVALGNPELVREAVGLTVRGS